MAVCYRHPGRETGVACSNCGRPICPDCMTPTPVGMRCPECSRQRTRVRTGTTLRRRTGEPVATKVLIGINVAVYLAELATGSTIAGQLGGTVWEHGALYGPLLSGGQHEYWRLLTAGFLHAGLFHIGLNMISLWFVGRSLEPAVGSRAFLGIYLASLLAGSFGALVFQPDIPTVGASTAIFGIFGALIVVARARGIPIWESGLGIWLVLNLAITFTNSSISKGGHVGGLIAGFITGWLVVEIGERRRMPSLALGGCTAVAAVSVLGAVVAAGG